MPIGKLRLDEESLAEGQDPQERLARGAFFTPLPLVQAVFDLADPLVPDFAPFCVVDPAAGAGAFLAEAHVRYPRTPLFGLELDPPSAATCRQRVPGVQLAVGDALRDGWSTLCAALPEGGFELWVGNPPYNGTSAVLGDAAAYRALRSLLGASLPGGTSLRDDYAFFLLRAADRLSRRPGALAFVTSATLLDAFLYSPLREALLGKLKLREVVELGQGAFRGTRVRTCVTVWSSAQGGPCRYRTRKQQGPFLPAQLQPPVALHPASPDFLLRPADPGAQALDLLWRKEGELLTALFPVHSPGLKTRFDELLVDEDPGRLLGRVDDFLRSPVAALEDFARLHRIPDRCLGKLQALKATGALPPAADPGALRPFWRYAGARHRGRIPPAARAHCYLDRRLIPRGDHRFRGDWDPHLCPVKLVFNTRELPLAAALLEEPGCVHDHRHARFAPLLVPLRLREEGLGSARPGAALGEEVPNLSPRGLLWAASLGGPLELFRALTSFINSPPVQEVWAPTFGACRDLPVSLAALQQAARGP